MKSITVKSKDSLKVYCSGWKSEYNPDKEEWEPIKQSEDEELQNCYLSLIDDIKRKEFEKNIVRFLGDQIINMGGWSNIKIQVSFSDKNRRCEMNIPNHENLQWDEIADLKIPEA